MQTIKTYRKVGAFYIACEEDLSTPIEFSARKQPGGSKTPMLAILQRENCGLAF
jgi:hypothetical protein